jgi:hypothetical protein
MKYDIGSSTMIVHIPDLTYIYIIKRNRYCTLTIGITKCVGYNFQKKENYTVKKKGKQKGSKPPLKMPGHVHIKLVAP